MVDVELTVLELELVAVAPVALGLVVAATIETAFVVEVAVLGVVVSAAVPVAVADTFESVVGVGVVAVEACDWVVTGVAAVEESVVAALTLWLETEPKIIAENNETPKYKLFLFINISIHSFLCFRAHFSACLNKNESLTITFH